MNDLFTTNKATLEVNGRKYSVHIKAVGMEPGELTRVTCDVVSVKPRGYGYSAGPTYFDEFLMAGALKSQNRMTYYTPQIDHVIFNDPATIVYWKDGDKTVVQARDEEFDPEKGLAMAISKKAMGNTRDYYIPFKRWLKKFKKEHPDTVKLYADDQVVVEFPVSTAEEFYSKDPNCRGYCGDCCPACADDISKAGDGCNDCYQYKSHFEN